MGRLVYRRMAQCLAPHRIRLRYPQNIVKLLQSEPSPHHCYHCTYNASDICHLCTQSANCFLYRDRLPTSTTNHQPPTERRQLQRPVSILVHTPHDRQNYRERMSLRSFSSIQDEGNRKHYTNVLIDQARQHPTTPLYNSP
jgi:hypothetical protein